MNSLITTQNFPKIATDLFNQVFGGQDVLPITRQERYPPFNAWVDSDGSHKIEIAVAGFSKEEISVDFDGKTLSITGDKKVTTADDEGKQYLYRGLAKRKFVRQFDVRGSFSIDSAVLKNGILIISLKDESKRTVVEVQEE